LTQTNSIHQGTGEGWKGHVSEQKQLKSVKMKMTKQFEVSSDKEKLNM